MTITQKELKKLLHYDPETGIFRWIVKGKGIKKEIAGCVRKDKKVGKSYLLIRINWKLYRSHRLAWLYMHGELPANDIDHEDGNGLNNKLNNLRSVNRSENMKNMRLRVNNITGICGVHWNKKYSRWESYIKVNKKKMNLGYFDNIFDAACIRKSAETIYMYHKNHGSIRPL